ncbi:MAG: protein TolR [Alphaproteobacteria bacterium]|nr:protein TolR [Alphaproteobacteria bacterium]
MGMSTRTSGPKSRRHRRGGHAPMSEINVTPFVDVMLVLLIIFMVAAPLLTSGVPLELPSAKGKQLQAQKTEPIVVSVAQDGLIYLGDEQKDTMTLEALAPKLQAIAKARGDTEQPIFVRGDKSVPYGKVARVMAQIRDAGFRKLSLVTQIETGG